MKTKKGFLLTAVLALTLSVGAQDVFDSDGDGFDDNVDNCTLVANEQQRDSDGDFRGNMCDADFNQDAAVNFLDLSYLSAQFLSNDPHADINGDGLVNFIDVSLFAGLFQEEVGPTGADPEQPPCTCYFSGDCPNGTFCNYGPGNFATEDICAWRDIKPFGVIGAGCSIESDLTTGAWIPDICDGVCTAQNLGSQFGYENSAQIATAMELWGQAMLDPSEKGGDVVDATLAARALALEFDTPDSPIMLGRYAADALAMSAGEPFHDYFCHYEGHPEDVNQPVVDLSNDPCRVAAGRITIAALSAELKNRGTARGIMQKIPEFCPNWHGLFVSQCAEGPGALNCAIEYIEAQALFLTTPSLDAVEGPELLDTLMGSAK